MYNLVGDCMKMYEQLEIEFKSLLTCDEFDSLVARFDLKDKFTKQYNYYFDTEDHFILKSASSFRIRFKNGKYKITYKSRKTTNSLIERSINIDSDKALFYLENGFSDDIINVNLPVIHHCGTLMTERASFKIGDGEIFLDKNYYSNIVDYEIEFECNNEKTGKNVFSNFLNEHSIQFRDSKPKIVRAFEAE